MSKLADGGDLAELRDTTATHFWPRLQPEPGREGSVYLQYMMCALKNTLKSHFLDRNDKIKNLCTCQTFGFNNIFVFG